jgi:hypothetical protein
VKPPTTSSSEGAKYDSPGRKSGESVPQITRTKDATVRPSTKRYRSETSLTAKAASSADYSASMSSVTASAISDARHIPAAAYLVVVQQLGSP